MVLAGLGGAAAAALPACGAGGTPAQQAATSKAPASIIYSTPWDQLRLDVLNRGMAIFRDKFSHIKVEVVPGQARDKVTAAFAAGTGPDSLWIEGQIGPRLYEAGSLLDLTPRVKAAKVNLEKDYISSKLEKWGPKIFAMPHTVSPHAWYYNKSLLERAGAKDPWDDLKGNWTWADQFEMARKVTKVTPGGGNDDVYGIELNYQNIGQLGAYVWTNGGKFIDTSASPTEWRKWKYTFSDPKTLEALQHVHDLVHVHRVLIPRERGTELQQAGFANLFSSQKTAMFEQSSGQLITQINAKNSFEWDVVPLPLVKAGGKKGVPLWSGNPTAISKDGKFLDAAWDLALQMALDDFQNEFSKARTVTAPLIRSLTIPGGFETPPPAHVSAFRAVGIENSGSWEYHPAFSEIETMHNAELGRAFKQEKTLRQAALDIDTQAAAILARN
jgi:ABC-type glycerol-3-phosphate transport system substrate-binding protein